MLTTAMNAQGGFTPAAVASQTRYLLNRYYVIIAISEGAVWGDRHCPLRYPVVVCISWQSKRNSAEQKK
jgi:hypothetical protein